MKVASRMSNIRSRVVKLVNVYIINACKAQTCSVGRPKANSSHACIYPQLIMNNFARKWEYAIRVF